MRPWSYSRRMTWEECPKQYWWHYVEKVPGSRPPSTAANRGHDLHALAERYLIGELKIYPPEFQRISAHMMALKSKKARPEQKLAVTAAWEPCEYDAPEAYMRGIIDVIYEEDNAVHIQDWKSGQVYPEHSIQMEDYVAIASAHYPTATSYITRLLYIDQGLVTKPKITAPERLKPIRMLIDGQINNAESDTIFPVRPGGHCKWCDYAKKYGGPCQFG